MTREQAELQRKILLTLVGNGSQVLDITGSEFWKPIADLYEADLLQIEYNHAGKISFTLTPVGWHFIESLEALS